MPIGTKDKGNTFDVEANSDVVSGDPVIVGGVTGVAQTTASNTLPGNENNTKYYATVRTNGEWLLTVAGTLAIGATVFVGTGAPSAGKAVKITALTVTEGTGAKKVFGFVTGLGQSAGTALVSLAGTTNATGAA